MHRSFPFILAVVLATMPLAINDLCFAQAPQKPEPQTGTAHAESETAIPEEKVSTSEHVLTLNGRAVKYLATAGTLLLNDESGKPYGSMFYVAYTEKGVQDEKTRPVTFLYNGGPGAASLWLHMGSVGPVRVETDSPQPTGPPPYRLVDNQYSLLDKTDLVFVDAVGTGFSRPVGKATEKDFAGVDQDIRAFDRFITRYITVNERWNSPKFLMGESYGTTRSAALADALQGDGIPCNGVILVSTILNYGIHSPGFDERFIGNLPSYAAIAYYHNKLPQKPSDLKSFLEEVRAFARGPYADALSQGDNLSKQQADAIAAKVSAYTGLPAQYVKEANLRVDPSRFRKELLRGEEEILGRYDARFEGTDVDAAGETPGYDPSDTGISGAFVGAFHDYLARDLRYETKETYLPVARDVIRSWEWKHRTPNGDELQLPYVAGDLADAMRKNPKLKVFSANGLFDLATPFFLTEFDLSHMNLDPKLRQNVQFGYYPAGHMIYLNVEALKQLKNDLDGFYAATLH
ncbi:MAG TPA: peptidase S10 [Acidobacteriaceae bacterium]